MIGRAGVPPRRIFYVATFTALPCWTIQFDEGLISAPNFL
jgi:hypothetical protein